MIVIGVDGGYAWSHLPERGLLGPPDPRFWQFRGAWGECWLGPVDDKFAWNGFVIGMNGSSPYMDWYNEKFYIHLRARSQ